jgi:hypothetical protein
MIRLSRLALAAALCAAPFLVSTPPAEAANIVMCRGAASAASPGPARWVAPGSSTAYTLDNMGCATVALADIPDAQAGGFTQSGSVRAIIYNTGVATGTTDFVIGSVPASAYVHNIIVSNSVAAAITGGISFGTTANGTEVVTALTCGSSCLTFVADSALTKRVFSLTAATPIHAAAVTAWNSANATITVLYSFF